MENMENLTDLLALAEASRAEFDAPAKEFAPLHTVCAASAWVMPATVASIVPTPVPEPEPEVAARSVPSPQAGRPVFRDPTDPNQIHAIAKRMPVFLWVASFQEFMGPIPFTRIKAQLLECKGRAETIGARVISVNGADRLEIW